MNIPLPFIKTAYVKRELNKLRQNRVYNTELGDIVPQESTRVFGVNIVVHDWSWDKMNATVYKLTPPGGKALLRTVHLLRTNENHYDLLMPITDMDTSRFEILEARRVVYEAEEKLEAECARHYRHRLILLRELLAT